MENSLVTFVIPTKTCTSCKIEKEIQSFSRDKNRSDGYDLWCKSCKNDYKKSYHHTKEGLATQLFVHQRSKSKKRCHPLPDYSKKELKEWLFNHIDFERLFSQWVNSGFDIEFTPSIDRLNDYLPYSFDNIRLCTWKENNEKFSIDEKKGINTKKTIAVVAINIKTEEILEFYSIAEASRRMKINSSIIVNCCKKKIGYKSASDYKWYYKDEYEKDKS